MNAFSVLGLVGSACTEADVRKAYRTLALRHHPDKTGPSEESEERMKYINNALEEIMKHPRWLMTEEQKKAWEAKCRKPSTWAEKIQRLEAGNVRTAERRFEWMN